MPCKPQTRGSSLLSGRCLSSVATSTGSRTVMEENNQQQFLAMVRDIATELDLQILCHKILVNVGKLTQADRGSLFLMDNLQNDETCDSQCNSLLVPKLFDVTVDSDFDEAVHRAEGAVPIPLGVGIAGHVAEMKTGLRILDAYSDPRFLRDMDECTGYRTSTILCLPIFNNTEEVVGVAELVNKKGKQEGFSTKDEEIFRRYLVFAGIGIQNARLFAKVRLEQQRNQVLLNLARSIFEEQTSLEKLVSTMMIHAHCHLSCQRIAVFVLALEDTSHGHGGHASDFATGFELLNESEDTRNPSPVIKTLSVAELNDSPFTKVAKFTGDSMTPLRFNSKNYSNPDSQLSALLAKLPETCNQFLSVPIFNSQKKVVGVVQLVNKLNQKPFTKEDQDSVEAFGIFCGLAIHNTQTYEEVCKLMAKQKVALECLSYHARAAEEDVEQLKNEIIPSDDYFRLSKYDFNDFILNDDETCKCVIRMFLECELVSKFRIPYGVLCSWVLSVKKNYRPVKYHNWRHAVNVAQTMYSLLRTGKLVQFMTDLDVLSLLVACLSHDLDHRGTNNAFQSKVMSPLAVLYSTSTMEHHHLDQCLMILNDDANNILQSLSAEEYKKSINLIEHAILSTDLAIYFRKKNRFITMVENGEFDWQDPDQKELLCGMMMTSCDVSAIAKPWPIQHRVAKLVAEEFFEQGDIEKLKLNQQPIAMMDRDQQDNLPKMQIGFIDSICLPLYKALSDSFPWVLPVYESCLENRRQWKRLADLVDIGLTWIDRDFIGKPIEIIAGTKEVETLPLVVTELHSSSPDQLNPKKPVKSILKIPANAVPPYSSAPTSPHDETLKKSSRHLTRMRSLSLDTQLPAYKHPEQYRDINSKMCSIS